MANPLVLIHGAFAGPWCLENFTNFFRDSFCPVKKKIIHRHTACVM